MLVQLSVLSWNFSDLARLELILGTESNEKWSPLCQQSLYSISYFNYSRNLALIYLEQISVWMTGLDHVTNASCDGVYLFPCVLYYI